MLQDKTKTLWELLEWVMVEAPDKEMQTDRFTKMLASNRHLFCYMPIIKVAGTNGKGSVCAMLEQSLVAAGKKVGLYTSPHLVEITERFRINGRPVSHNLLENYAQELKPTLFQFVEENGPQSTPSFFEILVLIALQIFHDEGVDIAVFEAGVGGYNDATSLLPSVCSVITTVGLDHQDRLGESLQDIAADKAGIANADTQLIIGPAIPDELKLVIENDAASRNVCVQRADAEKITAKNAGLNGYKVELVTAGTLLRFNLPLLGEFQLDNLATVVAVVGSLIGQGLIDNFNCLTGIEQVSWQGRLEYLEGTPDWLLDVAHNQPAFQALADTLPNFAANDDIVLLYGAAQDKDFESCVEYLPSIASEIYLLDGFYRSESVDTLTCHFPKSVTLSGKFSSTKEAVDTLTSNPANKNKLILAAGSVFMVGQVRDFLVKRRKDGG